VHFPKDTPNLHYSIEAKRSKVKGQSTEPHTVKARDAPQLLQRFLLFCLQFVCHCCTSVPNFCE